MWWYIGISVLILFLAIRFFAFAGERREAGDRLVEKHFGNKGK
jgi:hypothetical protein